MACLYRLVRAHVVRAEDGNGLGEGGDPALEPAPVRRPVERLVPAALRAQLPYDAGRSAVDFAVEVVQGEAVDERVPSHVRIAESVVSAERKAGEEVLDEMPCGELSDEPRVLVHGGEALMRAFAEYVDDRFAGCGKPVGEPIVQDTRDESVAVRHARRPLEFVEFDYAERPVGVRPRVADDSLAESASVCALPVNCYPYCLHFSNTLPQAAPRCQRGLAGNEKDFAIFVSAFYSVKWYNLRHENC